MPKSIKLFRDRNKAVEYRNRQRKINYQSGDFGGGVKRKYEPWEEKFILESPLPDRDIAKRLDRSIASIQHKRMRLLRGYSN